MRPQNMQGSKVLNRLIRVIAVLVAFVAVMLASFVYWNPALRGKLDGPGNSCSWYRAFTVYSDIRKLADLTTTMDGQMGSAPADPKSGLTLLKTPFRSYRIKAAGDEWDGRRTLLFELVEHEWIAAISRMPMPEPGDIVIDCGAHVGTFSDFALRRGAQLVVAIEPDPTNFACLRDNFSAEIAAGHLLLVQKAISDKEGKLQLSLGRANSGSNSLALSRGPDSIEVLVTTLDTLAGELGLEKVDFIKIDIEGSEREAIQGGAETIRRHRPRIIAETIHYPGEAEKLRATMNAVRADYSVECGPCEARHGSYSPHYLAWY